jgi:hypothetical protein
MGAFRLWSGAGRQCGAMTTMTDRSSRARRMLNKVPRTSRLRCLSRCLFSSFVPGVTSPGVYWAGIVLISVVGTQITDNLHDNHGVALTVETSLFGGLLALAFLAWWLSERTLSIHTIYSTRRESFYWLVVLFTLPRSWCSRPSSAASEQSHAAAAPSTRIRRGLLRRRRD